MRKISPLKCEILEFIFDVNTLELANYESYDHSPGIIYGYNSLFCKTQFVGLKTHIMVCKIIKLAEKYIDFSDIHDEGDYYHTRNMEAASRAFDESTTMIETIGKILKEICEKAGLKVVTGDEI